MFIEDTNNITSLDTKVDIKIDVTKTYLYDDREVKFARDIGKKVFTEIDRNENEAKFAKNLTISLEGLETTIDNKNYKWSYKDNLVVNIANDDNIDKFISLDFENKLNLKKEIQKSFIEEFEKAVTSQTEQLNLYDFFDEIVTNKMTELSQNKQNTDSEENTQNSKEENTQDNKEKVDFYYVLDENTIVYNPKEGEEEEIKVNEDTFEEVDYYLISKEDKIDELFELLQNNTFDRPNLEILKSDLENLYSLDDNTMLLSSLSTNEFIPLETDKNGNLTQENNPNAFNVLEDMRKYENEKQNVSLEDNLENIKNLSNDFNNIFTNSDDDKPTQENKNSSVKKQR